MISLSTGEPVAWTPPWITGDSPQRRYLFRAGSVRDRAALEADLAGECRAGPVYSFRLRGAFAEGARALLADRPDYAEQLIELDQAEQALAPGDRLSAEDEATLEQARETLTETWPAYRALVSQQQRRNQFAPILAFERFCVGWEGEGLPEFARSSDGKVRAESLAAIPPADLTAGGLFAYSLMFGQGEVGNSEPPSKRVEGQRTSNSRSRRVAGKSARKGGRKTRSSSSRTGSSRS